MLRCELRSRRLMTFILSTVALSETSQTRGEREREGERVRALQILQTAIAKSHLPNIPPKGTSSRMREEYTNREGSDLRKS